MRLTHLILISIFLSGCYNMRDSASLKTYEKANLSRKKLPPEGVVAFSSAKARRGSNLNGQELYEIHCLVCHGAKGKGNHDLGKYGLPYPPSFHLSGLLEEEVSYFIKIMTQGRGAMVSYRGRLTLKERKEIALYIKELQDEMKNERGKK